MHFNCCTQRSWAMCVLWNASPPPPFCKARLWSKWSLQMRLWVKEKPARSGGSPCIHNQWQQRPSRAPRRLMAPQQSLQRIRAPEAHRHKSWAKREKVGWLHTCIPTNTGGMMYNDCRIQNGALNYECCCWRNTAPISSWRMKKCMCKALWDMASQRIHHTVAALQSKTWRWWVCTKPEDEHEECKSICEKKCYRSVLIRCECAYSCRVTGFMSHFIYHNETQLRRKQEKSNWRCRADLLKTVLLCLQDSVQLQTSPSDIRNTKRSWERVA